jgi:hypothetical protein
MDKATLIKRMQETANIKPLKVPVKGWGDVYVKALTTAEVEAQTNAAKEGDEPKDKRTLAVGAARIICDENGNRIFDDNSEQDLTLLGSQPWAMLSKIISASNDFNGLTEKGTDEAKKD